MRPGAGCASTTETVISRSASAHKIFFNCSFSPFNSIVFIVQSFFSNNLVSDIYNQPP